MRSQRRCPEGPHLSTCAWHLAVLSTDSPGAIVHSWATWARLLNLEPASSSAIKMGLGILPTCQSKAGGEECSGAEALPSLSEEAGMKGSGSLNHGLERNLKNRPWPGMPEIHDVGLRGRVGVVGTRELRSSQQHRVLAVMVQRLSAFSQRAKARSALGEMGAPIFSLTRVAVRPRRGRKLNIKNPSEESWQQVTARGLGRRQ